MIEEKIATKKPKRKVAKTVKKAEKTTVVVDENTADVTMITEYSDEEIKQFQCDFDDFRDWLVNKPYLIDNRTRVIKSALILIKNNAKWTIATAPGLNRIHEELKVNANNDEVYLSSMQLHALWFFISKIEGDGLSTAKNVLDIQAYIGTVHDNYQFDYKRLEYLNGKIQAGGQQVPLSDEGFEPEIIAYDDNINWRKDWELLKAAIAKRTEEKAKETGEETEIVTS